MPDHPLARIGAIAAGIIAEAIDAADGDWNDVDLDAAVDKLLEQMTEAERAAFDAFTKTGADRTTHELTAWLDALGCRNPPAPEALHVDRRQQMTPLRSDISTSKPSSTAATNPSKG